MPTSLCATPIRTTTSPALENQGVGDRPRFCCIPDELQDPAELGVLGRPLHDLAIPAIVELEVASLGVAHMIYAMAHGNTSDNGNSQVECFGHQKYVLKMRV